VLPGCAFAGRTGGDEFSIALSTTKDKIEFLLDAVRDSFSSPFCIDETCVEISLSMGVAFFPGDARTAMELMQMASMAEREAKFLRKGYVFYTHELGGEYRSELPLRAAIREGLDQEQFFLEYQPKIRVGDIEKPVGAEALIRWEHPTMGRVAPDQFISATEQQGMIQPVTEWVLRTAIRDLIKFRMAGIGLNSISVNISPYALFNQDMIEVVDKILQAERLEPSALVLEVTETSIHLDNERLIQVLIKLEEQGVNISIDDFGTGQGALVYLRYLPTAEIKIDRTFVVNMKDNKQDYSIVKSLVHLAQDLGCEVCAEGVEDGDTLELLRELKCDLAQGDFISRPLPYKAFVEQYGIKEL
jgi:EAL domain-containing protein (putative c-di-GMP-specific phosphodiesterase class I)